MTLSLDEMIELGDPDELLREIDRLCERRDWEGLDELRYRCDMAVERGKQLWGVAGHAEYRLALEAPAEYAVEVIEDDPGPFVLGPLPEVLASTHTWDEMAGHIEAGPHRHVVAYERVVRGEDLSGDAHADEMLASFELPLSLRPWEPKYAVASYSPNEAEFAKPAVTVLETVAARGALGPRGIEPEVETALQALVAEWTKSSNGSARVALVEGGLAEVLGALNVPQVSAQRISLSDAVALMAWAGASGGFHGRRNGAAAGRAKAWWALALLLGDDEAFPDHMDELVDETADVTWWTWSDNGEDAVELNLAMVDAADGVAFGVAAFDKESLPNS